MNDKLMAFVGEAYDRHMSFKTPIPEMQLFDPIKGVESMEAKTKEEIQQREMAVEEMNKIMGG